MRVPGTMWPRTSVWRCLGKQARNALPVSMGCITVMSRGPLSATVPKGTFKAPLKSPPRR